MARKSTTDEIDEAAEAQWHREHALEVAVDQAYADWMFRTMGKGDRYEFWTEMMRQAKALSKFIREEALSRLIDADAVRGKDGLWYGKPTVYDRKLKKHVQHPIVAAEEAAAKVRERRSQIRAVASVK